MAGFAYGLDEGGAIPDDAAASQAGDVPQEAFTPEEQPAALNPPGDVPQEAYTPQAQSRSGLDMDASHVPQNAKRIIQYLMGAGAAHPDVVDKFAQGAKLEHPGISDDDANLLTVLKAKEHGGDEAASAVLQSHMQQYNAKNAFAYTAATGSGGKPADPQAAAKAASEASQHMLDGSTTTFHADPHGAGYVALVQSPGADAPFTFQLSPQQFASWVKPGGTGQWDKVISGYGDTASALSQLTQASPPSGDGTSSAPAQAQSPPQQRSAIPVKNEDGDTENVMPGDEGTGIAGTGFTKDQLNKISPSKTDQDFNRFHPQRDSDIEARGRAMFPWASQSRQREAWMNQQEDQQASRQNKIDVEKEKGTFRVQTQDSKNAGMNNAARTKADASRDVATTRANAQIEAAKQRAVADAAKQAAVSGREDDRRRAKIFTTLINSSTIASQADIDKAAKAAGITLNQPATSQQPQAAAPQAPAPRQQQQQQQQPAQRPANVPAGAKLYNGKWYTRGPNGEAVPVQ